MTFLSENCSFQQIDFTIYLNPNDRRSETFLFFFYRCRCSNKFCLLSPASIMSRAETMSDTVPFFSDDSETEPQEDGGSSTVAQGPQEEQPSGVSKVRALLTVFILCYINLLNYMDRFTVAGTGFYQRPILFPSAPCRQMAAHGFQ